MTVTYFIKRFVTNLEQASYRLPMDFPRAKKKQRNQLAHKVMSAYLCQLVCQLIAGQGPATVTAPPTISVTCQHSPPRCNPHTSCKNMSWGAHQSFSFPCLSNVAPFIDLSRSIPGLRAMISSTRFCTCSLVSILVINTACMVDLSPMLCSWNVPWVTSTYSPSLHFRTSERGNNRELSGTMILWLVSMHLNREHC